MSFGLGGFGLSLGQPAFAPAAGGGLTLLDTVASDASWGSYSGGPLSATHNTTSDGILLGTGPAKAAGTFAWTINAFSAGNIQMGVRTDGAPVNTFINSSAGIYFGVAYSAQTGNIDVAQVGTVATVATAGVGDKITVVYSATSVEFKKNGVSLYIYTNPSFIPATSKPTACANQTGSQVTLDNTLGW